MMQEVVVCGLEEIPPGEGRNFSVIGEAVAIFRTRTGGVYAVQAACPHKAGPLSDGLVGGTTLICPLHGWKFDLTSGAALMGDCGLRTYRARVDQEGQVVLRFGEVD